MKQQFDFLVIGSGIAGLNFALEAVKYGEVAIVTKKELMESNSNYAQGGVAAVMDKKDSFAKHIKDTIIAGCYLNNKKAVETMVKEAPQQIRHLINLGVGFNRVNNKLALSKEGGHSEKRIVHAKDATGREIERALIFQARHNKRISIFESHLAIDLITKNKKCLGAIILDSHKNKIEILLAKATILSTGGAGQIFARNCNPKIATGDGIAMAYRAKAKTKDLEFIQFHPTALAKKNKPTFLISETVRGEGGILKNSSQKPFMKKYHTLKDLAPRDIVSRAIVAEMKKGPVYLDIRDKGEKYIKQRFPYIYNELWWFGIFMDKNLIPVAPAAHYICGGVHTNLDAETNLPGLYAFGEVAHTGVHGANRLASNSLLECLVFSHRAIKSASKYIKKISLTNLPNINTFEQIKIKSNSKQKIKILKNKIQNLMWSNVGIIRKTKSMQTTLQELQKIEAKIFLLEKNGLNKEIIELKNICQTAILITTASLKRKKSIGTHFIIN